MLNLASQGSAQLLSQKSSQNDQSGHVIISIKPADIFDAQFKSQASKQESEEEKFGPTKKPFVAESKGFGD